VLPEVIAEAARRATDEEVAEIRRAAEAYHATFAEVTQQSWDRGGLTLAERERVMGAFRDLYGAFFAATHNALWALLAEPLLRLRAPRSWQTGEMTVEDFITHERRLIDARVEAITARAPAAGSRGRHARHAGRRRSQHSIAIERPGATHFLKWVAPRPERFPARQDTRSVTT